VKAVVQRVIDASVQVGGTCYGRISRGLLVYLGVAQGDTAKDAEKLAEKIAGLRVFDDAQGKMNLSIKELPPAPAPDSAATGVLAVSQFTLLADARKGRRPYYGNAAGNAAGSAEAKSLYEYFMRKIQEQGLRCEAGVFQAHMELRYTNDGPVTIILDSREL
jgi:D-tyrosyl-tRNA(Tyr) deacylase